MNDLGFRISDFGFGRGLRSLVHRCENSGQFFPFLVKSGKFGYGKQPVFLDELDPESGFVRLFECAPDLINPIRTRPSPASCSKTRGDRGRAAENLFRKDTRFNTARKGIGHSHYAKSELFGSPFQFVLGHPPIKSEIRNLKS